MPETRSCTRRALMTDFRSPDVYTIGFEPGLIKLPRYRIYTRKGLTSAIELVRAEISRKPVHDIELFGCLFSPYTLELFLGDLEGLFAMAHTPLL